MIDEISLNSNKRYKKKTKACDMSKIEVYNLFVRLIIVNLAD